MCHLPNIVKNADIGIDMDGCLSSAAVRLGM